MTLLNRPAFFVGRHRGRLQQGEQTSQENPSLDTLENLVGMLILWSISKTCMSRLLQRRLSIFPRRRYIVFLIDFSFSSPWDMLTSVSFQGFNFSELLSFDPASISSVLLDVDDQQLQPTGVVNQLRHMKDLLSAPIDTLVQDSDEMKYLLEEI
jgi:hypothetical protein